MTKVITLVKPLGEHRERLLENIGRDHWRYDGIPEPGTVVYEGALVAVWLFEFVKIEHDVQEHMIRSRALVMDWTLEKSAEYLHSVPSGIPQMHIKLETVEVAD